MLIENVIPTNNNRKSVTRVCDDCGKAEVVSMSVVWKGRKRRGQELDYCKKCAYNHRNLIQPRMSNSPSWNGGRYLNENGYYRIYNGSKYIYEHKQIMSDYLGREVLPQEKVHHIDLDKTNNLIKNLYLCKNKRSHRLLHCQIESLGFSLFGLYIWYDWSDHKYTLKDSNTTCNWRADKKDIDKIMSIKTYRERRRTDGKQYARFTDRKNKYQFQHIAIMRNILGDRFPNEGVVHHVNGDTLNNNPNNLDVLTRSQHVTTHITLQKCVTDLMSLGIVEFDHEAGLYKKVQDV